MNESQEIRAEALHIVGNHIEMLYRRTPQELAQLGDGLGVALPNDPASLIYDALKLAPIVADYIRSGNFNTELLLKLCPGGEDA